MEDQIEVMSAATWSAEARVGAEAEEEQAKWRRIQSWTLWAKRACEGGASKGHQWIKGPRGWSTTVVQVGEREVSYSPTDVANDCLDGWQDIWEAGDPPEVSAPSLAVEALPAIQAGDVRQALKKFKWRTVVGLCAWNPRDWDKSVTRGSMH